ncbi:MAG: hypothetical protein ABIE92_08970 [bacterium]
MKIAQAIIIIITGIGLVIPLLFTGGDVQRVVLNKARDPVATILTDSFQKAIVYDMIILIAGITLFLSVTLIMTPRTKKQITIASDLDDESDEDQGKS